MFKGFDPDTARELLPSIERLEGASPLADEEFQEARLAMTAVAARKPDASELLDAAAARVLPKVGRWVKTRDATDFVTAADEISAIAAFCASDCGP